MKKGDYIRCIESGYVKSPHTTIGKLYKLLSDAETGIGVSVIGDKGEGVFLFKERFERLKKVKPTDLAKKMYPEAIEIEGWLVV